MRLPPAAAQSFPPRLRRAVLLALSVAACGGDDGVTIRGDVGGLDTLGFRGDSLLAQADRLPNTVDSLRLTLNVDSVTPRDTTQGSRAGRLDPAMPAYAPPGVNPMSKRAQARGDSMARAAAQRLVGNTGANGRARGDSVRGIVTLTGPAAARSAALRTSQGALVALSGMATSGLTRLEGADIVVRGVRVSPRDVVVSDYVVRAMRGQATLDGRLEQDENGAWTLLMTDGSGRRRLTAVPASLQSVPGSRVWMSMPENGGAPTAFGIIPRR